MTARGHQNQLIQLVQSLGGFITTGEANAAAVSRMTLSRAVNAGVLSRIQRGVYRLEDSSSLPPVSSEALDLLEVQLRFPYARPCLTSALHLHDLTTTRPNSLEFAVTHQRQHLQWPDYSVTTFFFSPTAYEQGVIHFPVRGRILTTYSIEKTLVDLLRYSPKLGRELYLEGLKKALTRQLLDQDELIRLAKVFHVWKTLSHDLEVLCHDQDH